MYLCEFWNWQVGPRLTKDRERFPPNNVLLMLAGAGLLWLGWAGFNGGDPYAANVDSSIAVINTNICAATSLLVWTLMDVLVFGKPSVIGAVQGMITGLVVITPAAGNQSSQHQGRPSHFPHIFWSFSRISHSLSKWSFSRSLMIGPHFLLSVEFRMVIIFWARSLILEPYQTTYHSNVMCPGKKRDRLRVVYLTVTRFLMSLQSRVSTLENFCKSTFLCSGGARLTRILPERVSWTHMWRQKRDWVAVYTHLLASIPFSWAAWT